MNSYLVKASKRNYRILLLFLLAGIASVSHGQVGVGTTTPHASAQLDVASDNKGFLTPRMTESARAGISNPAAGLLVFQTDGDSGFWYFTGSGWTKLATGKPAGTIIPYASGGPISLTTLVGGISGTVGLVGFGSSVSGVPLSGPSIDLTGGGNVLLNFAFSVPRDGVITSLSAFFSSSVALALLGTTIMIKAELFKAPGGTNTFMPVLGASTHLSPGFTNLVSIGDRVNAVREGIGEPVQKGDRLLLVFSAMALGMGPINTVTGYASAGVNIE